jgi:hypothetical protein
VNGERRQGRELSVNFQYQADLGRPCLDGQVHVSPRPTFAINTDNLVYCSAVSAGEKVNEAAPSSVNKLIVVLCMVAGLPASGKVGRQHCVQTSAPASSVPAILTNAAWTRRSISNSLFPGQSANSWQRREFGQ